MLTVQETFTQASSLIFTHFQQGRDTLSLTHESLRHKAIFVFLTSDLGHYVFHTNAQVWSQHCHYLSHMLNPQGVVHPSVPSSAILHLITSLSLHKVNTLSRVRTCILETMLPSFSNSLHCTCYIQGKEEMDWETFWVQNTTWAMPDYSRFRGEDGRSKDFSGPNQVQLFSEHCHRN